MTESSSRSTRRTAVGIVSSAKMERTAVVRSERRVKHPLYGKFLKRSTRYVADNPGNEAQEGDKVEIAETRPTSKTKRWRVVRVIEKGTSR